MSQSFVAAPFDVRIIWDIGRRQSSSTFAPQIYQLILKELHPDFIFLYKFCFFVRHLFLRILYWAATEQAVDHVIQAEQE